MEQNNQKHELIEHLSLLDHYKTSQTEVSKEQYVSLIQKILSWVDTYIQIEDQQILVQILEYLQKKYYDKISSLTNYLLCNNITFLKQRDCLEQKISQTEISQYMFAAKNHLQISLQVFQDDQIYARLNRLKFTYSLIKLDIQIAAFQSQWGENQKALQGLQQCLKNLVSFFRDLKIISKKSNNPIQKNTQQNSFQKPFTREVELFSNYYEKKITLIQNLLNNVLNKSDQISFFQIINQLDNFPELQNIQKIKAQWIKNISIANFIHFEYFSQEKLNHVITTQEVTSEGFLALLVFITSTIFYMVSTELRILSLFQEDNQETKIKPIFESNQLNSLKKTSDYIVSEKIFIQAIKLAENYLEESLIITQLKSSYAETFQKNLDLSQIVSQQD